MYIGPIYINYIDTPSSSAKMYKNSKLPIYGCSTNYIEIQLFIDIQI